MHIESLRKLREDIAASLWLVPVLCGAAAIILSFIVPEIDNWIEQDLEPYRTWIFFGSASAARTMLSVIAGSLITVISLLFSITILTLHQAASQYTPRVIRTFMDDRANQMVLGVYLATFLYSVLVMRRIRGEDSPGAESIPMLAVTFAILLAIVCLMMLVYFIHHSARAFQPSGIMARVHGELLEQVRSLYPSDIGEPLDPENDDLESFRRLHGRGEHQIMVSDAVGFVRALDEDALSDGLDDGEWAAVLPRVGDFVLRGQPLVEVGGRASPLGPRIERLHAALVIDNERTMSQDAMFGIRQLADIALKGLSPSIHDPTTAEQAISLLGDALVELARRQFPSRVRIVEDGGDEEVKRVVIWANRPIFADYVDEAFSQIRHVARDDVHVTMCLLDTLSMIGRCATGQRFAAVHEQVNEVLRRLDQAAFSERDRAAIRERAGRVLRDAGTLAGQASATVA